MTASSPSPETIRFIARILAAQPTSVTEVAETIANIARTVDSLGAPAAPSDPIPAAKARTAKVARTPIAPPETAPIPETIVLKPRGAAAAARPRRRIAEIDAVEPEIEVAPEPAAQPRLLRRAEIVHTEHDPAASLQAPRAADAPLRGVVKWFDGKTGKGALRLTGVSGDVALERGVLEQSAIKRLYKDQEIEATIQDLGRGRITLLSLSLPGRNPASAPTGGLFGGAGTPGTTNVNRQARSVMVEVKRDGVRATSAREVAEHVLGGIERLRNTRRMTPSK